MRTFTNTLEQLVEPTVQLDLTPVDQSTTYVHCSHSPFEGIVVAPTVSWEGPFTGGLGLPSGYRVRVAFNDLDRLKGRLAPYNRAVARLRVDVGSNTFYPHVGRVRSVTRRDHPLELELSSRIACLMCCHDLMSATSSQSLPDFFKRASSSGVL